MSVKKLSNSIKIKKGGKKMQPQFIKLNFEMFLSSYTQTKTFKIFIDYYEVFDAMSGCIECCLIKIKSELLFFIKIRSK